LNLVFPKIIRETLSSYEDVLSKWDKLIHGPSISPAFQGTDKSIRVLKMKLSKYILRIFFVKRKLPIKADGR